MERETIPGRECGDCDVCCVSLTINDPELQKVQGFRCGHLSPGVGCGIYDGRPKTCRDYNCGWRMLKWVKPTMRPNQSRVLIGLQETAEDGTGISVMLLSESALRAEGLAETIAAAVMAGLPVFLVVPGPPGYTSAKARIDGLLSQAVTTHDKATVLTILRRARKRGLSGKTVPIRLKKQPAPVISETKVPIPP